MDSLGNSAAKESQRGNWLTRILLESLAVKLSIIQYLIYLPFMVASRPFSDWPRLWSHQPARVGPCYVKHLSVWPATQSRLVPKA